LKGSSMSVWTEVQQEFHIISFAVMK